MRRRLVFRAAPLAILVAAFVTGGDRLAAAASPRAAATIGADEASRRSPPTGSCRSLSSRTPARPTPASATPPRAPALRSSSRAGRRCSLSSDRRRRARGRAPRSRSASSARTANVAIRGERPEQGRVNYLLGNDPAKWHTGLRTYERVVYRNLWPGVDMVFAGQNGRLKYEFLVRPGARVDEIRLAYRGAKRLSLDRQGNLRASHIARRSHRRAADELPARLRQAGSRREHVCAWSAWCLRLRPRPRLRPWPPARNRPRARLLHVPGRKRQRRTATASRSTAPATPT